MSKGVDMIAAERARQKMPVEAGGEGYSADHDFGHADELALAGACYALPADDRRLEGVAIGGLEVVVDLPKVLWPWDAEDWKPSPDTRIVELVKAGALIAAAIDSALGKAEA